MINISTYFASELKPHQIFEQSDLDFVDVQLDDDNLLFLDPRLIESSSDALAKQMADCLYKYFAHLMLAAATENLTKAEALLHGISEPKETRLGYGNKNSNGSSAGPKLKKALIAEFMKNPLMKEKKINNLSDIGFFMENFNSDRISDLTTKIIEHFLIDFTQSKCKKYGIPMKISKKSKLVLNPQTLEWEKLKLELPVFNDGNKDFPIIFVPKTLVSLKSEFNSTLMSLYRFARNYIIEIGDQTFLNGVLRNGKNDTILVDDFDALNKNKKKALMEWVLKYQNLPTDFWLQSIGRIKPLSDEEIRKVVYSVRVQGAA